MVDSLDKHFSSPDISIDQHIKDERIALGKFLEPRKAIYLDTRYWIILRDTAAGKTNKTEDKNLLSIIRNLVHSGQAFCPLSSSAFIEFCKQPEQQLREATAQIVDELSLGVTLSDSITLQRAELFHYFRTIYKTGELHPLHHMVWTKTAYVMGTQSPINACLSPKDELAIQKAFYDHLGQISFLEIIKMIGNNVDEWPPPAGSNPSQMNADIAAHANKLKSFQQTYRHEIEGIIDVCGEDAADILHQIGCEITGKFFEPSRDEWKTIINAAKNIMAVAFKKSDAKKSLKMMHIGASLHADLRWNKGQQFKPNDLIDFRHAMEALAFCDVFLTERRLANAVTNRLHLDELYGRKVCHLVGDACEVLEPLAKE